MQLRSTHSCAVLDLAWIEDEEPIDVIKYVTDSSYYDRYEYIFEIGHITFVEAFYKGDKHYGASLAAYIKKHKLGTVIKGPTGPNPGHNSKVTVYVWKPSQTGLKAWCKKFNKIKAQSLFA